MNKHLFRIIVAGASIAASAAFNVAAGQVLGGSGLGGSLGGTMNGVAGTLNGAASIGGTLDTDPLAGRMRSVVDQSNGLIRDSNGRLRDRARSTTGAVKSEAKGATKDIAEPARGATTLVQEEAPALTDAAAASAEATADAAGSLDISATTAELTKSGALDVPDSETASNDTSNETAPRASLIPALSERTAPTTDATRSIIEPNPTASPRASAHGGGEAEAKM